jgi:hypothetical protein
MNCVTDFLQKFLNLEKDNNTKLALILETIKKETGIELKREDLEIKGDNLKINCNPVMRNEIFMHKTGIEDPLKSQKIFLKVV